jgi:hypothetical protein
MRKVVNKIFKRYFRYRKRQLDRVIANPHKTQYNLFRGLMQDAAGTEWGKRYGYQDIKNWDLFASRVPIQNYESLKPYIDRMMLGQPDVLWPGTTKWFSKSSGTTADKSKYIPVTEAALKECHQRGPWDTMTFFYDQRPDARQFECKSLLMGGSLSPFEQNPTIMRGDVSAIMIHNTPPYARPFLTPDFDVALMADFEEKIERMAKIVSQENDLVMIGGVPTWTIVLFRRILEITGKQHMLEVWPDLQGYIHGGVSFKPYREQFQQFLPGDQVSYQETYNASEGYFATQNDFSQKDMLLLLENGVYYEFLPVSEWDKPNPKAIPLEDVEVGKDYALVISTNAGLWRYQIGDTVTFTSTRPYKIQITGRTKQFINAFGEEVMVANTDEALAMACEAHGAVVSEYTVAPVYIGGAGKGSHQWLVEFERAPADLEAFATSVDQNLQQINSDYEAKRYKGMALERLHMQAVPTGTFFEWLKTKGKYGGQHKVPRLANHREYMEEILQFLNQ